MRSRFLKMKSPQGRTVIQCLSLHLAAFIFWDGRAPSEQRGSFPYQSQRCDAYIGKQRHCFFSVIFGYRDLLQPNTYTMHHYKTNIESLTLGRFICSQNWSQNQLYIELILHSILEINRRIRKHRTRSTKVVLYLVFSRTAILHFNTIQFLGKTFVAKFLVSTKERFTNLYQLFSSLGIEVL